ncbi:peroxidase 30 [Physcomitrium patens]|uniref:peroxidase 30 n=1 Tax=Physcomitrium patens TaxID=3218 RepID=UPI000D1511B3|nr:peroxidase 43-like [Physcomitrium patens]|eukprot:XP_024358477.1 peroxidase 43-like [Physcomitrella patens]
MVLVVALSMFCSADALVQGFYSKKCPNKETILFDTLKDLDANDGDLPPILLLHFQDCFVRVRGLSRCLIRQGRRCVCAFGRC